MTPATFLVLLPALLGLAGGGGMAPSERPVLLAQNEVVLRIQIRPSLEAPGSEWVERDGPRCIAVESIRGAMVSSRGEVDFILPRQKRVRARLGKDCPALDFYNGFYLSPEDDRICAERDSIRSRIGGSCTIERFQALRPKQKR